MFEKFGDVVTVKELGKMLRVGDSKAYSLVRNGEIQSVRVGKKIVIPKENVINFLFGKEQVRV